MHSTALFRKMCKALEFQARQTAVLSSLFFFFDAEICVRKAGDGGLCCEEFQLIPLSVF